MPIESARFVLLSSASNAALAVTSFWFWEATMWGMTRFGVLMAQTVASPGKPRPTTPLSW
jgi:hypothetical protein